MPSLQAPLRKTPTRSGGSRAQHQRGSGAAAALCDRFVTAVCDRFVTDLLDYRVRHLK